MDAAEARLGDLSRTCEASDHCLPTEFDLVSSYNRPFDYLHLFSAFPKVDHQVVASGQIIGGLGPWLLTTASTNS